eukprot:5378305-Pyramimonas_sp.AAC.1
MMRHHAVCPFLTMESQGARSTAGGGSSAQCGAAYLMQSQSCRISPSHAQLRAAPPPAADHSARGKTNSNLGPACSSEPRSRNRAA